MQEPALAESVFDFTVFAADGTPVPLTHYRGDVLLIVNVASRCGFTPQYRGLEDLYRRYRERGFSVLGFPCNQFGRQEPGSDDEIHQFCEVTYGVTFPIFRKIEVNGPGADPLYRYLKSQRKGRFRASRVNWNFTKFLVGRDGRPVARFGSRVTPAALEPAVMQALEA